MPFSTDEPADPSSGSGHPVRAGRAAPALDAKITGTLVRQHVLQLEKLVGNDVVARALERLGPEDADQLRHTAALGWLPVLVLEQFYEHIAQLAGRDVGDLHWEIGQQITRNTFRTVWRMLLKLTTDAALVARTPIFHSKTYDTGRLSSRIVAPGKAELTLSEWNNPPPFVRRGLCIGITTVLELAGRKDIVVRDSAAGDNTLFYASWTP